MLPDIQPGNTKILYFFNCLLDGMHTTTFSFVPFIFYCPWVPVPPEVFSEVPSDPIASSALCAEYAACVPG